MLYVGVTEGRNISDRNVLTEIHPASEQVMLTPAGRRGASCAGVDSGTPCSRFRRQTWRECCCLATHDEQLAVSKWVNPTPSFRKIGKMDSKEHLIAFEVEVSPQVRDFLVPCSSVCKDEKMEHSLIYAMVNIGLWQGSQLRLDGQLI